MERDNFKCTLCGDSETTLNVHHEEYSGNPWEANPDKLKTICQDCHKIVSFNKYILIDRCYKQESIIITHGFYYEEKCICIFDKDSSELLVSFLKNGNAINALIQFNNG